MSDDSEKIAGMAIMSMARDIDELKAEIERLRGENDALKDEVELKQSALTGTSRVMGEEIERLRKSLDDHLESEAAETRRADRERDRARTAEAEIERLRHEVKLREQICADATLYARRLQEADDEIERLRGLLGDVQIILDSHNNIVGNLNGEITRLRGLLREVLLDSADLDADWARRVHKALGE